MHIAYNILHARPYPYMNAYAHMQSGVGGSWQQLVGGAYNVYKQWYAINADENNVLLIILTNQLSWFIQAPRSDIIVKVYWWFYVGNGSRSLWWLVYLIYRLFCVFSLDQLAQELSTVFSFSAFGMIELNCLDLQVVEPSRSSDMLSITR